MQSPSHHGQIKCYFKNSFYTVPSAVYPTSVPLRDGLWMCLCEPQSAFHTNPVKEHLLSYVLNMMDMEMEEQEYIASIVLILPHSCCSIDTIGNNNPSLLLGMFLTTINFTLKSQLSIYLSIYLFKCKVKGAARSHEPTIIT